MSDALRWITVVLGGYLLGNFQSGLFIASLFGHIDIRKHGSGATGTTNVTRILGALPGTLTLLLDVGKGALGAWLGHLLLGDAGMMLMGACVIIGHNWPALFSFRGGKGIAAALGVLFFIKPYVALILLGVAIVIIAVTGYVSVASLVGFTAGMVYFVVTSGGDWVVIGFWVSMWAMAVYSHRANIRRLLAGTENRLTFGKSKSV